MTCIIASVQKPSCHQEQYCDCLQFLHFGPPKTKNSIYLEISVIVAAQSIHLSPLYQHNLTLSYVSLHVFSRQHYHNALQICYLIQCVCFRQMFCTMSGTCATTKSDTQLIKQGVLCESDVIQSYSTTECLHSRLSLYDPVFMVILPDQSTSSTSHKKATNIQYVTKKVNIQYIT